MSTPGSSGFCAATYSLATKFIPSRNGVTRATRLSRKKPASERWEKLLFKYWIVAQSSSA
jgi:hypothetical protein